VANREWLSFDGVDEIDVAFSTVFRRIDES
jgi:hypothetical protein